MVSNEELSYAAGIIDGEGCIDIVKTKPCGRRKTPSFKSRVRVSNTDKRLIVWLHQKFGGYVYNSYDNRKNRRNKFEWCLNDDNAVEFLNLIKPFMKLKIEQANLLIEFRKTFNTYYGIFGLPEDILIKRNFYFNECKRLKKIEFSYFAP